MAQFPTSSTNRPVDPVVQSLTYALANKRDKYIAGKVLPLIPTQGQQTGTIMGLDIETLFGNVDANYRRGEGASYHESYGPKLGNTTFRCQEYGDSVPVDLNTLSRSELPADLKAVHAYQIMENLLIAREVRHANVFGTAGNWTNSATPGVKWDAAGGDPIGDLETAIETVAGYGLRPNTMVIGRQARRTLQTAPALLEFLPTTVDRNIMPGGMLRNKLADLFEIPSARIFYGDAVRNSLSPGQTITTLADVWGDWVWVGYLDTASVAFQGGVSLQPTAAACFSEFDFRMEEWDDPSRNSIKMKVAHSEDEVVIQAQLGYLVNDVTT